MAFNRARETVRETNRAVLSQTLTLMNGAFALVAALAWNEAIKAALDHYFPEATGLYSRFVYAIAVTVLVVIVTRYFTRIAKRFEDPEEDIKIISSN